MKRMLAVATVVLAGLLGSGTAMADHGHGRGHGYRGHHGHHGYQHRGYYGGHHSRHYCAPSVSVYRPYYPAPAYPVYDYPRSSFGYSSPGLSFYFAR